MSRNVGNVDRLIRVVAGAALITLAFAGTIGVWGYLGIIPLVTGVLGSCPAYSLFGIDTCSRKA